MVVSGSQCVGVPVRMVCVCAWVCVCVCPVPSSGREALQLFEDAHGVPGGLDHVRLGENVLGERLEEQREREIRVHLSSGVTAPSSVHRAPHRRQALSLKEHFTGEDMNLLKVGQHQIV